MDKKDLIYAAALKLFVEYGFHGTATSKIAQEAGVANGTLFNYFQSKDELVIALYIQVKEELAGYINKNTTSNTGTKETMKSQMRSSLFWALDNSLKFRFIQQIHTSPYIHQVAAETLSKQVLPHLTLIQKGIIEGIIKPLPVDLIFALISSQTLGIYQYITSKQLSRAKQKDIIQTTFDMLWDMIT